jgi:acetolactate synthase I/II/III large subunit
VKVDQARLLTGEVSIPDAVVDVLIDAGVEVVFGIPGGATMPIFAALNKRHGEIETVITRQETLASAMAEATGRLTGRPSVLIGQAPWILGYGGVGIIESLLSSSPLLVMTDFSDVSNFNLNGTYQNGTGSYGAWDARTAFSGLCKRVMQCRTPVEAVLGTQMALRDCVTGEPGPITMIYSSSSLAGTIGPDTRPRIYSTSKSPLWAPPLPDNAQLDRSAELMLSAKRGVMILGNGVRVAGAMEEARSLAEQVDFAVATTATGKGCFPETHELALGVFGNFGTAVANAAVGQADTILIVGSKLGGTDTALLHPQLLEPQRQNLIQIDIESLNVGRNLPVDVGLLGNAPQVLSALRARCEGRQARKGAADWIRELLHELGTFHPQQRASDAKPIMPERLIAELEAALPDDAILTCDAGENRILIAHCFQTRGSQQVLMAGGVGPMGYSVPTALAAKRLNPGRVVVATTGDGGMGMALNGLLTAIEYEWGIVIVVFNNAMLGWSSHAGAETPSWQAFDFAEMARGMGCRAWRVSEPAELGSTLLQALAPARVPTVVDVAIDSTVTFRDVRTPLMG